MDRRIIVEIRRGFFAALAGLVMAVISFETAHGATANNTTVPGAIQIDNTQTCAGIRWFITGDDDLDCTVGVQYRRGNDAWKNAQPLMRVEPASVSGSPVDPGNLLAGSIFGLQPGARYEIRLTLNDHDGGASTQTVTATMPSEPSEPSNPQMRYVVPGSGGGSGTSSDPFRGIAAADAVAQPGDVFVLAGGTYTGTANFTASGLPARPIVWKAANNATVILDGQGTAATVVNFTNTHDVQLANLSIRSPERRAVVGTNVQNLVLRHCSIDVYPNPSFDMIGIDFRGAGQSRITIVDCTIDGHVDWAAGRNLDSYAVMLTGYGHVIHNNVIRNWWDGTNLGNNDTTVETSNCDYFRNEVYNCTDDGIETDGSRCNVRVFENRFTNVLSGVSCQPVFGGPVYIVRNAIYDWQLKPLKFHVNPTGMLVYNNTFVGADPDAWSGGQWRNATLKNNIFIGGSTSGHNGDPICLDTDGERATLDYNGWYQAIPTRFASFSGAFYATLADFRAATGQETHARLVNVGAFVSAVEPALGSWLGETGFVPPYAPGSQDLRLAGGSAAVNAGTPLANITDGFLGSAPDLGAYEQGTSVPAYGPAGPATVSAGEPGAAPPAVALLPATPNPFREQATLKFEMPKAGWVSLLIFDVRGRLVKTLQERTFEAEGRHTVVWDGTDDAARSTAAGTYFCRAQTELHAVTQKIIRIP